jgi:hypothetical protein
MKDIFKNRVPHLLDQASPRKHPLEAYSFKNNDDNGFLHSNGDSPALILSSGTQYYYKHGWLHRLNGAALINKDLEQYFIEGKFIEDKGEHTRLSRLLKIQSLDLF